MANKEIYKHAKQYSKDYQPSPESKSKPKKKTLLKQIASQIVTGKAVEDLKPLATYLGVDPDQIDIETLMHLKQINKAIEEGDTKAYQAVLDRLKGKPHQSLDHTIDTKEIPILKNDPLADGD